MELEIIRYIQSFGSPVLDMIFEMITMVGEQYLALVLVTWFYWNYNKDKGRLLGYAVFTSLIVCNTVKDILKFSRPIGQEGIISHRVETATGYSFPSGHTQNTTTLFVSLMSMAKRWWFTIFSWIVILAVALSRVYLGVHYPKDVLAAIVLGTLVSLIAGALYNHAYNKNALLIASLVVLLPTAFFANSPDYIKSLGLFIGFVLGCTFEELFVGFSTLNTTGKKILRFLLGMIFLGIIYVGGKLLLPEGNLFLLLRYGAISFFGVGIYPLIFKKLNL